MLRPPWGARSGNGSRTAVAEAIGAQDGVHALVSDTTAGLADAVLVTFSDPAAARSRAAAAREYVRSCFRWDEAVERLEGLAGGPGAAAAAGEAR